MKLKLFEKDQIVVYLLQDRKSFELYKVLNVSLDDEGKIYPMLIKIKSGGGYAKSKFSSNMTNKRGKKYRKLMPLFLQVGDIFYLDHTKYKITEIFLHKAIKKGTQMDEAEVVFKEAFGGKKKATLGFLYEKARLIGTDHPNYDAIIQGF